MEAVRREYSERTGLNFAIARTPAESTSQNFAVNDLLSFGDDMLPYVRGKTTDWRHKYNEGGRTAVPVYYTNGFMVNHGAKINLDTKLDIEQKAFPILSGGNICNIFLGEKYPDVKALYELTKNIALNTMIGYWSYTRDITSCSACNFIEGGEKFVCTNCGSANVKTYSRITGYYQATDGWNAAKHQELKDRYKFNI
jgi:ribonucleoside-triphosphate reductase